LHFGRATVVVGTRVRLNDIPLAGTRKRHQEFSYLSLFPLLTDQRTKAI
jgi:hypothetical protein